MRECGLEWEVWIIESSRVCEFDSSGLFITSSRSHSYLGTCYTSIDGIHLKSNIFKSRAQYSTRYKFCLTSYIHQPDYNHHVNGNGNGNEQTLPSRISVTAKANSVSRKLLAFSCAVKLCP